MNELSNRETEEKSEAEEEEATGIEVAGAVGLEAGAVVTKTEAEAEMAGMCNSTITEPLHQCFH